MKVIKHLRTPWLILAMVLAVAVGETISWQICHAFGWRWPSVAIAAICVGLVAVFVAWQYDGTDD